MNTRLGVGDRRPMLRIGEQANEPKQKYFTVIMVFCLRKDPKYFANLKIGYSQIVPI